MSEKQLLRYQSIEPTDEIIAEGLGAANSVYLKFITELKDYDITLMDWRFYNDGKAWLSKGEHIYHISLLFHMDLTIDTFFTCHVSLKY